MTAFLYVELDVFAILMLIFMAVGRSRGEAQSLEQRLFNYVLFSTAIAHAVDAMQWYFDGRNFPGVYSLNTATAYLYFLVDTLIPFLWLIYCDYKSYGSVSELKRRVRFYLIPFGASLAFIIANFWTDCAFYIDSENVYHRGSHFVLFSIVMFSHVIWAAVLTIGRALRAQSETDRRESRYLSLFMIFPAIGYLIQLFVYGLPTIWVCATVALFLIYIKVQNRLIYTDELTGVNNRRMISREFTRRVEFFDPAWRVYAVMIDADGFKRINDTLGHAAGDALLVRAAKALEKVCAPHRDFLARTGGDEFLIFATRRSDEKFELLGAIDAAIRALNPGDEPACAFSLSCGVAVFREGGIDTLDRLLSAADRAMFRNKAARKAGLAQSAS